MVRKEVLCAGVGQQYTNTDGQAGIICLPNETQ